MVMSSIDENSQCKIANTPPLSYLISVHCFSHRQAGNGTEDKYAKMQNMKSNSSNGQAANGMEDVVCAVTSSEVVFKLFNVESDAAVVVLKKFDDLRLVTMTYRK